MKKFFLIVPVLLIVLVGYYFYERNYYNNSASFEDAQNVSSIAIKQNDLSLCGKITTPPQIFFHGMQDFLRGKCYAEVAQQLKRGEICDSIPLYPEPASRYACIIKVAITTKDLSLCDKLPANTSYSRDNCIYNVNKEKQR